LFNLIIGNELCNSIIGDVQGKEKLSEETLSFKPEFIFHFCRVAEYADLMNSGEVTKKIKLIITNEVY
jgi:hypothetical protein